MGSGTNSNSLFNTNSMIDDFNWLRKYDGQLSKMLHLVSQL